MKKKFTAAIALFTALQFANVQAAAIDNEIAILAADQGEQPKPIEKVEEPVKPVKKTKKELEEEKKRLKEEKKAAEKKLKEEKKAARKQIEEGKKEVVKLDDRKRRTTTTPRSSTLTNDSKPRTSDNIQRTTNPVTSTNRDSAVTNNTATPRREPVTTVTNTPTTSINRNSTVTNTTPRTEPVKTSTSSQNVNTPNPMQSYPSFEEVSKAVGFTPLYIPKKSGYTVNEIYSIGNRMAEIRYGRRWEPEVSLRIRTYKRTPGEELKDISGVNNVKWRVDTTGATTVYVAKINDNTHAAAWAVGDYTFSAYVENLSFAAFHSLVVEELVDLSAHYFVN